MKTFTILLTLTALLLYGCADSARSKARKKDDQCVALRNRMLEKYDSLYYATTNANDDYQVASFSQTKNYKRFRYLEKLKLQIEALPCNARFEQPYNLSDLDTKEFMEKVSYDKWHVAPSGVDCTTDLEPITNENFEQFADVTVTNNEKVAIVAFKILLNYNAATDFACPEYFQIKRTIPPGGTFKTRLKLNQRLKKCEIRYIFSGVSEYVTAEGRLIEQ